MVGSSDINNSLIMDIHRPTPGSESFCTYKSMLRLSPESRNAKTYMRVMDIIAEESTTLNEGHGAKVRLVHSDAGSNLPHQIETDLEPQQLLGILWTSGLINQEEMTQAYRDLELSPSLLSNRNQTRQPGFSLF
jgi:hypothetical protein